MGWRETIDDLVKSRGDCPECGCPMDDGRCQFCEVVDEHAQLVRGIHEVACIVECRLGKLNVDRHDGRWYVYNEHGECNDGRHADSLIELVRKLGKTDTVSENGE